MNQRSGLLTLFEPTAYARTRFLDCLIILYIINLIYYKLIYIIIYMYNLIYYKFYNFGIKRYRGS